MIFNSIEFVIFFIVVTHLYYALNHKYRWSMLLAASCFFYMFFKPIYILILFGTILIDYFAAILISQSSGKRRKLFLVLSIIANIGVLAVFKYYNFLIANVNGLINGSGSSVSFPYLNILLPIGLSFHTFQAMSYTIEVYRGNFKPERHLGIYSLYVMFYPQLVAGPIERPQNILPQLHRVVKFHRKEVVHGLRLILWGMFKKIVVADRLAQFVNQVYDNHQSYEGISLWVAMVFFSFQIYLDFSAYSDIAIGTARTLGIELMQNFNNPYSASSIKEFWSRWHISLSTWFRDYVYIPLGGSKVSYGRWAFNILVVFMLSGLWHGANWTFVVWGTLHGLFLIIEKFVENRVRLNWSVPKWIKTSTVFGSVTIAWVYFRAENFEQANYVLKHLFTNVMQQIHAVILNTDYERMKLLYCDKGGKEFFLSLLLLGFIIFVQNHLKSQNPNDYIKSKPVWLRWGVYASLFYGIVFLGVFEKIQFIYFQF